MTSSNHAGISWAPGILERTLFVPLLMSPTQGSICSIIDSKAIAKYKYKCLTFNSFSWFLRVWYLDEQFIFSEF
jgi:hypothetical protein